MFAGFCPSASTGYARLPASTSTRSSSSSEFHDAASDFAASYFTRGAARCTRTSSSRWRTSSPPKASDASRARPGGTAALGGTTNPSAEHSSPIAEKKAFEQKEKEENPPHRHRRVRHTVAEEEKVRNRSDHRRHHHRPRWPHRPDPEEEQPQRWAIPGGCVDYGGGLGTPAAARRRKRDGLEVELVAQFSTYSDPRRNPRQAHPVHGVRVPGGERARSRRPTTTPRTRAGSSSRRSLSDDLCFDHAEVLRDYFRWVRSGERRLV